jgi:hypothetical protein
MISMYSDPDIEAGGIQHEHPEQNKLTSEYDLKYKWLPLEEVTCRILYSSLDT